MPEMSVEPYREITFDADGDIDAAQRDRLAELDVTDLVMFAHGWNNSPSVAARLYSAFFAPFPGLLAPGVRLGYVGVVWPSMKFTDEPIPDFRPSAAAPLEPGPARGLEPAPEPALDRATQEALTGLFPGHRETIARLAQLLEEQPESEAAFAEFGVLARRLAEVPAGGLEACFTDDLPLDELSPPAVLYEDTLTMCRKFTLALEETGAVTEKPALPSFSVGGGLGKLWKGAKELLRQTTYYAMKRRAGTVGELGLGPLLGQLARSAPRMRVHLVGHSQGARLVSFALRGLPEGARNVKSLTLLQGAFSHYVFASKLPHAPHSGGALRSMQHRVDGPVVACYSRHDSALGVIYPLASSLAGDSSTAVGLDKRWWAMGHDGIRAVERAARLTLDEALRAGIPVSGCVSVDTASVVRRGGPPSGAHSDICHPELARVVLAAGRIGR